MTAICPFCGQRVSVARFPWLYQRHTKWATVCVGSRSVFTLHLLGLRDIEPEHIPTSQRGAA